MQLLVGMIYAWIVVYAIFGVYFVILSGLRRHERPHVIMAALCIVQAVYAYACARQYQASDPSTALYWTQVRLPAGLSGAGLLAAFLVFIAPPVGGNQRALAWMTMGAVVIPAATYGLLAHEPEKIGKLTLMVFGEPATILAVGFRPVLSLLWVPITVALVIALVKVFRAAWGEARWLRPIGIAALGFIGVGIHDGLIWTLQWRTVFMMEHAYFGFAFVVAVVMTARMAKELSMRTVELRQLNDTLRSVRETLEQKEQLAAVGELSAIVAHEIRNPLAVLTNASASLRRPDVPLEEKLLLLAILDEETARLNRIVGDLLQLARPIVPQYRRVEVAELIERALTSARNLGTHVTITIANDAGADCFADGHLLRQALENLVDNSVQAMGSGGALTIAVTMSQRNGRAGREIAVIDTGEGMSTDVKRRALDAFFTTRASGTGLGLAIVERIMRAHGGTLDIQSARGNGTTVRLWIPDGSEATTASAALVTAAVVSRAS